MDSSRCICILLVCATLLGPGLIVRVQAVPFLTSELENHTSELETATGPYSERDSQDGDQITLSEELETFPIQYKWKRSPYTAQGTGTSMNKSTGKGFWSVHPSDTMPMRKPPGITSQTKNGAYKKHIMSSFGIGRRSIPSESTSSSVGVSYGSPYHPIPRSVAQKNRHDELEALAAELIMAAEEQEVEEDTDDEGEQQITGLQKRQSPGSYLLLKLSRLNRAPPSNQQRKQGESNRSV